MNLKLDNVRIAYPSLFEHEKYNGDSTGKYAASFLIPKKDAAMVKIVKDAIDRCVDKAFDGQARGVRSCLSDGDDSDNADYFGYYILKSKNSVRPTVVDMKKSPITERDNLIDSGCYVNTIISISAFDCKWGKLATCELRGVQYVKPGQTFGASGGQACDPDDFGGEVTDDVPF